MTGLQDWLNAAAATDPAAWEQRVDELVQSIRAEEVAALETRVSGLETAREAAATALDAQARRLEARGPAAVAAFAQPASQTTGQTAAQTSSLAAQTAARTAPQTAFDGTPAATAPVDSGLVVAPGPVVELVPQAVGMQQQQAALAAAALKVEKAAVNADFDRALFDARAMRASLQELAATVLVTETGTVAAATGTAQPVTPDAGSTSGSKAPGGTKTPVKKQS